MQKRVRAAAVVCDETEAAIGIPHFEFSGSHKPIPLRLRLIDASFPKLRRPGEPALALGTFLWRSRGIDDLSIVLPAISRARSFWPSVVVRPLAAFTVSPSSTRRRTASDSFGASG